MKKKKVWLWILFALALIIMIFVMGAWSMFGEKLTAAMTVTKLNDGLYSMSYVGDYGFDAYMEQGGGSTAEEMAEYITSFLSNGFYTMDTEEMEDAVVGCSAITVKDSAGNMLFGRNYDWETCQTMIVHTKPVNGYASVSTVCLDFLGFGEDWLPDANMGNQFMALAAVYVPLDGMNEKGLCIADLMAGDKEETHQDTGKVDLTTTAAIRLVLDHAATVDEAIALLQDIDIHSDIGSAHHFAICDATGRSVVVEYVDNQMYVVESPIVTNHYLADVDKQGTGSEQSHARFETLSDLYDRASGVMTTEQVKEALAAVSQSNFDNEYEETMWSIVFVPETRTAFVYFRENYQERYVVELNDFSITRR